MFACKQYNNNDVEQPFHTLQWHLPIVTQSNIQTFVIIHLHNAQPLRNGDFESVDLFKWTFDLAFNNNSSKIKTKERERKVERWRERGNLFFLFHQTNVNASSNRV